MNQIEYDALPGIRRSDLWVISQTPAHFRYHMDHPEEPTPALIFGQAAHKFILEQATFLEEFALMPKYDRRTKEGKRLYEMAMTETAGKTLISDEDMIAITEMRNALLADPEICEVFDRSHSYETSYSWLEPETGEICKCKVDMISDLHGEQYIVDYKTTGSCADGAFERSCRKYGYDFQAGFYTSVVSNSQLEDYGFIFIAQEKTAPYVPRLYICDPGFIEAGKRKFMELLHIYHDCKDNDSWPGYAWTELYEETYD